MKWAPRFSLRTLFVLVTVCALGLSAMLWIHHRGLRQQRACEEVTRLGGGWGFEPHTLPTHYDFCFRNIAFVGLSSTGIRDDDLAALTETPKLKGLGLSHTAISDRGLPHITRLKHLEDLAMDGTAITDEAIPHLAKLKDLKRLVLRETAISDDGIAELQRALPNCEITAHFGRRCRACREFYLTRHISQANLCPKCEEPQAGTASEP